MEYTYRKNLILPIGTLHISSDGENITEVGFGEQPETRSCPVIDQCMRELSEYCAGTRREFEVPLRPSGTDFQQRIWRLLQDIPYGTVTSYGALAVSAGSPKGARAVGMACNRNPIAVIIPCHRVVSSTGALTGYAGGLEFKRRLLELEGAHHE